MILPYLPYSLTLERDAASDYRKIHLSGFIHYGVDYF